MMERLQERERLLEKKLTFEQVLETGKQMMRDYGLEGPFVPFK